MCWEGERCSRVFITFCVDIRAKQALITGVLRGKERGGLLRRNKDAVLSSCGLYFEEEEDAWRISILSTVKSC